MKFCDDNLLQARLGDAELSLTVMFRVNKPGRIMGPLTKVQVGLCSGPINEQKTLFAYHQTIHYKQPLISMEGMDSSF